MSTPIGSWPASLQAIPCLLLEHGKVLRAGPQGPAPLLDDRGRSVDLFDVIDGLAAQHRTLYLVDLAGIDGHDPQLDYIQEVSRDVSLWVDAGVRNAEQAIDVIVAGAEKATISGSRIEGPRELRHAWELSQNLLFEVEIWDGKMTPVDRAWGTTVPAALAAQVREVGPPEIVVSFRGTSPDWTLSTSIAASGPTWIAGSVAPADADAVAASGARGAIYPLGDELMGWLRSEEG